MPIDGTPGAVIVAQILILRVDQSSVGHVSYRLNANQEREGVIKMISFLDCNFVLLREPLLG